MQTLTVDLADRSYPIFIGTDLLSQAELIGDYVKAQQVMIVSNETVAPLYLDQVKQTFAKFNPHTVILPDGETYKNLEVLNQIFDQLLETQCDRTTTIVALGGGVIGDMAGFAAACYQRGIAFIQIPTTLLAQVDSSVGGKTGVNHRLGKNMIGAFYQPQAVLIDTNTLNTLDDRQLSAGLAEVVKYGLIRDAEFFTWLEQNCDALLARDPAALAYAIERSCQNKADIVAADELEGGVRALLNLGHTFGHAVETGMGYGRVLHGEAVAIGMCLAGTLSVDLGWLSADDFARVPKLLTAMQLPTELPSEMNNTRILNLMQVDKKVRNGVVYLVLLKAIGEGVVTADYSQAQLESVLGL